MSASSRPPVPAFPIGSIVYLKVNPEENKGMVTGYSVGPAGIRWYEVTWGNASQQDHAELELTDEQSFGQEDNET